MKLEMHRNSLFAILARQPWWISALVAAGVFGVARVFLPPLLAAFAALPFAGIAAYAGMEAAAHAERGEGRRRARAARRVAARGRHRGARGGLATRGLSGGPAARRGVRPRAAAQRQDSVVACRRLKAKSTGPEPLRELHAAGKDADEVIYVAAGEVTALARTFAAENRVKIVEGLELMRLAGK